MQARWNRQRCSRCSINKFTYCLEIHKWGWIVGGAVSAQSTSSHTLWKCTSEMKLSETRSCSINKFTYILEMHKQDGTVRDATSAQPKISRTFWKCASKMGLSKARSVLNQQVHVPTGNARAGCNRLRRGQYSINKFTYCL